MYKYSDEKTEFANINDIQIWIEKLKVKKYEKIPKGIRDLFNYRVIKRVKCIICCDDIKYTADNIKLSQDNVISFRTPESEQRINIDIQNIKSIKKI